jgi:UDP-glucose 4-epimerase
MNVLVTGGAGYIGSHAVKRLIEAGHTVLAVDNLDRGHRLAVHAKAGFEHLDVRRTDALADLMKTHQIDAVLHFAAVAYVGESVEQPLRYYDNNVQGCMSLLHACNAASVERLVFSSTSSSYGQPEKMPITEQTPQVPINPYGMSKLMCERILRDYGAATPSFGFAALRYFNVGGCSADGTLGEDHDPESHLIPVLLQTALGQRDKACLFGDDYPTPDGTCIRDYVYVDDLVDAHVLVLDALEPGDAECYNLGIGKGHSVKEVIESARRVTGINFPVEVVPRRAGDPPQLYASADKIKRDLGWSAQVTDIDQVIETAWRWFQKHPNGYGD